MGRIARLSTSTFFVVSALASGAACVDLFHATDFPLCETDPTTGACESDGGALASSDAGDAAPDAGDGIISDLCKQTPKEARANAERACALLQACEGAFADPSLGACILAAQAAFDCTIDPAKRPYGEAADYWRCMANAKTCDAVDTCIFHGPPPTCVAGDGGSNAFTQCAREFGKDEATAPTIRVECAENGKRPRAVEPCAASAQKCTVGNDGKARCTGALGASGCPSPSKCVGDYLVLCKEGDPIDHGSDCSQSGARECVKADGGAVCAEEDVGICQRKSIDCEGGIAHVACKDGSTRTFDCGAIDMVCNSKPTETSMTIWSACTVTRQSKCYPIRQPDTCENGDVSTCVFFDRRRISCRDLGLGPCTTDHPSCALP